MPKHPRRQEAPPLTYKPADHARRGQSSDRGRSQRRQGVPAPTASARGRALRTTDPRKRVGALINILPDLLAQNNPTATREALDALTTLLKSHRRVVARFIREHGFKMAIRFLNRETDPLIDQWRAHLLDSEQALGVDSSAQLYQRAVELIREKTNPRHALARLVEESGLNVIAQLWGYRDEPAVGALFELPAPRKRGRPAGSHTRDPLAYATATVVSDLRIKPVQLLRALDREPSSDSRDHQWLNACRRRGDLLRRRTLSHASEIPVLVFLRWYYLENPRALLDALIPYLARGFREWQGTAGNSTDGILLSRLRTALESLLPH